MTNDFSIESTTDTVSSVRFCRMIVLFLTIVTGIFEPVRFEAVRCRVQAVEDEDSYAILNSGTHLVLIHCCDTTIQTARTTKDTPKWPTVSKIVQ